MTKIYSGMPHLNGHLLVAIDFETTGKRPGYHEPIQIAVAPLDSGLKPVDTVRPFYTNMRPLSPERAERGATKVHGLDLNDLCLNALEPDRVADLFIEWYENLELPTTKVLVPLAHNWAFERSFLNHWIGVHLTDRLFHAHARDAMQLALAINDMCFFRGERAMFSHVNLKALCQRFNIVNPRPHDALCDALAEAEVYRNLLMLDII